MAKSPSERIRSLWPLLGGNKRDLNTLDSVIKWVANTDHATRDAFNKTIWLARPASTLCHSDCDKATAKVIQPTPQETAPFRFP